MVFGVRGTFVSRKIGKVRWVPSDEGPAALAVTADWDSERDELRLWRRDSADDCLSSVASAPLSGGVAGLEILEGFVCAADSSGSVRLFEAGAESLRLVREWPRLHRHACSGLSGLDGDVATCGEDGRVGLLSLHRPDSVRSIEADACGLTCVRFLRHNEVLAGNGRGRVNVWDPRAHGEGPVATLPPAGDGGAALCATNHPARRHLALVGDESGAVAVWDLRSGARPVSYAEAHSGAALEMRFHPERPERLFTCSAAGELWRWNAERLAETADGETPRPDLEVRSLMPDLHRPVNSLDCDGERLICGCDNEAVYVIGDIFA